MGFFSNLVIEICALRKSGLDAVKIAKILDMPVRDVGYVIENYYEELFDGSN